MIFIILLHIRVIQCYFNKSVIYFLIHFIPLRQSGKLLERAKWKLFQFARAHDSDSWYDDIDNDRQLSASIANPIREIMLSCSVLTFAGSLQCGQSGKKRRFQNWVSIIKTVLCCRYFFQIPKKCNYLVLKNLKKGTFS